MNVINEIKAWWNKVSADAKQKRVSLKSRALAIESQQVLQAMEFQGELFICYKGMPIIKEDLLTVPIPDALENSRGTYMDYVTNNEI